MNGPIARVCGFVHMDSCWVSLAIERPGPCLPSSLGSG